MMNEVRDFKTLFSEMPLFYLICNAHFNFILSFRVFVYFQPKSYASVVKLLVSFLKVKMIAINEPSLKVTLHSWLRMSVKYSL